MNQKKLRGFAAMKDRARVKEIQSKGGQRAHELGVAHRWTTEEAVAAGKLGGKKTQELYEARKQTN